MVRKEDTKSNSNNMKRKCHVIGTNPKKMGIKWEVNNKCAIKFSQCLVKIFETKKCQISQECVLNLKQIYQTLIVLLNNFTQKCFIKIYYWDT